MSKQADKSPVPPRKPLGVPVMISTEPLFQLSVCGQDGFNPIKVRDYLISVLFSLTL